MPIGNVNMLGTQQNFMILKMVDVSYLVFVKGHVKEINVWASTENQYERYWKQ